MYEREERTIQTETITELDTIVRATLNEWNASPHEIIKTFEEIRVSTGIVPKPSKRSAARALKSGIDCGEIVIGVQEGVKEDFSVMRLVRVNSESEDRRATIFVIFPPD